MSEFSAVLEREDPRITAHYDMDHDTKFTGSLAVEDPMPRLSAMIAEGEVHHGSLAEILGYQRSEGGVFHIGCGDEDIYTALSFKAVSEVLLNNDVYSNNAYYAIRMPQMAGETILNMSGRPHLTLRTPMQPLFTPQMAAGWWTEKVIAETVETLVAKIERRGGCDLFLEVCARMPVHVIAVALGIDVEDYIGLRVAVMGILDERLSPAERVANIHLSGDLLQKTITARREEPRNDLISKFIATEVVEADGSTRSFTDEEIVSHARLFMNAGGGTTWKQLGITLFALLNNPDQLAAVRNDRSLIQAALIESVRWQPTDINFGRRVERDTVLAGIEIPKGAMIHMCLGAANRDPSRWEDPNRFDIFRPVQRSLAFGGGQHSCLGQHVSRQEMAVALDAILDRLPKLRWDPDQPRPQLVGSLFSRGPGGLPVVYG